MSTQVHQVDLNKSVPSTTTLTSASPSENINNTKTSESDGKTRIIVDPLDTDTIPNTSRSASASGVTPGGIGGTVKATTATKMLSSPPTLVPVGTKTAMSKPVTTATAVVNAAKPNGPVPTTATTVAGGPPPLLQNKNQDVRVDNWGNYCLQRLQVMYEKGDFTDLTLQFSSNNELVKVHRVAVNLCTEYFANLERTNGLSDEGFLVLPKDIDHHAMITIIKFFYTGKLEVRGNQFNEVYRTVKLMNITILTKLLEAHARKPAVAMSPTKKEPTPPPQPQAAAAARSVVLKQNTIEMGGRPLTKIQLTSAQAAALLPGGILGKNLISKPGPGGKTKTTMLARVQAAQPGSIRQQTHVSGLGNISIIRGSTQKRLPIWKDRKYAPIKTEPRAPEKWPKEEEVGRPTRFEWPEPDEDLNYNYMTPTTTSFMERQKAASALAKAKDTKEIFDAVKSQVQTQVQPYKGLKRTMAATYNDIKPSRSQLSGAGSVDHDGDSASAAKISKISLEIEKELAEMEGLEPEDNEVVLGMDSHDADAAMNQEPGEHVEINFQTKPVQTPKQPPPATPTTSIMKASTSRGTGGYQTYGTNAKNQKNPEQRKVEKTVRFAPEVEKENSKTSTTLIPATPAASSSRTISITSAQTPSSSSSTEEALNVEFGFNHSNIISEVLKKYPDITKDKKAVKLKIVQQGRNSSGQLTGSGGFAPKGGTKSKVSYIVLKSTSAPHIPGSVVKKPIAGNKSSTFWDTPEKLAAKKSSALENTTGPWICDNCVMGEGEVPAVFDSYYAFRQHLVNSHGERVDVRICEFCGYKASKRNLLLYHKYTKHGVDPPRNATFPHCDRCDYVALSESLLAKHRITHDILKEVTCPICDTCFKSAAQLNAHNISNLHRSKDNRLYGCPYCQKGFVRNISLKAHIRALHRDIARAEEIDDPNLPPEDSMSFHEQKPMPVLAKKSKPVATTSRLEHQQHEQEVHLQSFTPGLDGQSVSLVSADGQTIEILHHTTMADGTSVPISLVPSSEAEAMNNVASSIAASLGLDAHTHGHGQQIGVGTEFDGSQAVYIMDSSNQAVEVSMSGIEMTADGNMIIGGDTDGIGSGQFIVQDMQGNQFQRITGIDENGKQVIFFQLSDDHGQLATMPTAMVDESGRILNVNPGEGTVVQQFEYDPATGQSAGFNVQNDHMYLDPQKCSVFVSSGGVTTMAGTAGGLTAVPSGMAMAGTHTHMVLTSTPDGNQLIEMVPIQAGESEILHEVQHQAHNSQVQVQVQGHEEQGLHVVHVEGGDSNHDHEEEQGETMYVEMSEVEAAQHENEHEHEQHNQSQETQEMAITETEGDEADEAVHEDNEEVEGEDHGNNVEAMDMEVQTEESNIEEEGHEYVEEESAENEEEESYDQTEDAEVVGESQIVTSHGDADDHGEFAHNEEEPEDEGETETQELAEDSNQSTQVLEEEGHANQDDENTQELEGQEGEYTQETVGAEHTDDGETAEAGAE